MEAGVTEAVDDDWTVLDGQLGQQRRQPEQVDDLGKKVISL